MGEDKLLFKSFPIPHEDKSKLYLIITPLIPHYYLIHSSFNGALQSSTDKQFFSMKYFKVSWMQSEISSAYSALSLNLLINGTKI